MPLEVPEFTRTRALRKTLRDIEAENLAKERADAFRRDMERNQFRITPEEALAPRKTFLDLPTKADLATFRRQMRQSGPVPSPVTSPTGLPTPAPTAVSPRPEPPGDLREPTIPRGVSPDVQRALAETGIAEPEPGIPRIPTAVPQQLPPLEHIDRALERQDELRNQGLPFDRDFVDALTEQRSELQRGRAGQNLIETVDILSAIYGGSLVDTFNEIKAGNFSPLNITIENPLTKAERQQARDGLVRIASEAFDPVAALAIARSIPSLVKLAASVAKNIPDVVAQGTRRATDAPLIRLVKGTRAEAAGVPPQVPEGHVRLFRGESGNFTERNPFFSTDRTHAEQFGDRVFAVDVPQNVFEEARKVTRQQDIDAGLNPDLRDFSVELPENISSRARLISEPVTVPPSTTLPPPVIPPQPGLPAAAIPEPPGPPPEVTRALEQAEAFRTIDSPGFIGGAIDKIPGISHIQNYLRPANKLPPKIQNAWVASGGERAAFLTDQFPSRSKIFDQIDELFGVRTIDEAGRRVSGPSPLEGGFTRVRFIGPEIERVGIESTMLDIAQRPQFYDLTDEMRAFLIEWQERMSFFQRQLPAGYGAKVSEFIPPEGSVFLSNVDRADEMLKAMRQTEAQAIRQGRGATRVFPTAADRMKNNPDFNPVLNIRNLMSGMDEYRASVAGNAVFRQGIGGLTRVEAVALKHPALLKIKQSLTARITNLKARIATAERQIEKSGSEINRVSTRLTTTTKKAEPLLKQVEALELLQGEGWGPELSFLSGQIRELLQQAAALERGGINLTEKATGAVARRGSLLGQLDQLAPQLDTIRDRYAAVDLRPLQFVQKDIFRYFPADEARAVEGLMEFSTSHWVAFLDNVRGTAFSADLSPIAGVQLPLHMLFQPHRAVPRLVGAGKNSVQSRDLLKVFRESTMAQVVADNPQLARDFAFITGIPVQVGTLPEFSGGFLRLINPTILGKEITFGKKFQVFNERMFSLALRQSLDTFDDITQRLARSGVVGDNAKVIAADMATMVIPVWNPNRLGLSQARAAAMRALPTSISFLLRPAALIAQATTGFGKVALKQTLTAQEKMAVQLMTTFSGSIMMLSMTSAAISALSRGNDPIQAMKNSVDPNSPTFMSLIIGSRKVPMGGPYRGLFKVIWPREVDWAPVPVPFAGIANFALNRSNPVINTTYREIRNKDFFGGDIRKGELPEQILRGLAFAIEGTLPLAAGTAISGIRRSIDTPGILEEVGGQFLGVNLGEETPFQQRDLAVRRFAEEQGIERGKVFQLVVDGAPIEVDQSQKIDSFYDLQPVDRKRYEAENPGVVEAIKHETKRRADQGIEYAVRRQRAEDLRVESMENQLSDDEDLESGNLSPTQWRENRKDRRMMLNERRNEVYADLDTRDPKTLTDYYFTKLDEIRTKNNGVMTDDAWQELEQWVGSQTPEVREYIDANTGLAAMTPKEQEYKADLETLRPFWEIADTILERDFPENVQNAYRIYKDATPTEQTQILFKHGDVLNPVSKRIQQYQRAYWMINPAVREALLKWEYRTSREIQAVSGTLIGATP